MDAKIRRRAFKHLIVNIEGEEEKYMMDSKEAKQRMVEGRLYLPFQE